VKGTIADVLMSTGQEGSNAAGLSAKEVANVRNNLRRLANLPVRYIKKGTTLLHGSKSSAWADKCIGSNDADGYSYFTPDEFGWAGAHASDFKMRLTYKAIKDIPVLFFPTYGYKWYGWELYTHANKKSQMAIEEHSGGVGGLAGVFESIFPAEYKMVGWIGCSECEVVLSNAVIPYFLKPTGIAVVDVAKNAQDFAKSQKIINDLPVCSGGTTPGIVAPSWLTKLAMEDPTWTAVVAKVGKKFEDENAALFG